MWQKWCFFDQKTNTGSGIWIKEKRKEKKRNK